MDKRNKKAIAPPRVAALVTGFGLVACAAGSFWLYTATVYTPILLIGLLLLLPALVNLLLLIPLGEMQGQSAALVTQDDGATEAQEEDGTKAKKKSFALFWNG